MGDDLFYRLVIVGNDVCASGISIYKFRLWINFWNPDLFHIVTLYSRTGVTCILAGYFPMTRKLPDWFLSSQGGQIFIPFHHQGRNISSISSTNLHAHIIMVIIMIKKEHRMGVEKVSVTITHIKIFKAR